MEYIIEQFNIDLRKLDLYIENAENEYMFACEEASLYGDDEDFLLTEAGESFGTKLKNFFSALIEKVHQAVMKIVEKIKSLFTQKKVDEVTKTIQSNPELARQKVKVPDIKKLEEIYGKRRLLLKALAKKAKAGTLTQDELDATVEKYDKLTKAAKAVGTIVVAAGVLATTLVIGKKISKHETNLKENDEMQKQVEEGAKKVAEELVNEQPPASTPKQQEAKVETPKAPSKQSDTPASTPKQQEAKVETPKTPSKQPTADDEMRAFRTRRDLKQKVKSSYAYNIRNGVDANERSRIKPAKAIPGSSDVLKYKKKKYEGKHGKIIPDLSTYRTLARLIANDTVDTSALDSKIAGLSTEELLKLDVAAATRIEKNTEKEHRADRFNNDNEIDRYISTKQKYSDDSTITDDVRTRIKNEVSRRK